MAGQQGAAGGGSGSGAMDSLGVDITANTSGFSTGVSVVKSGLSEMIGGFASLGGAAVAGGIATVGFSTVASLALGLTEVVVKEVTASFIALAAAIRALPSQVSISVAVSGGQGGARAEGGAVSAGVPYLVGERGPEIVVPGTQSTVIPNHSIGAGAGGGHTFNINELHLTGIQNVSALFAALQEEAGRYNVQLGSALGGS